MKKLVTSGRGNNVGHVEGNKEKGTQQVVGLNDIFAREETAYWSYTRDLPASYSIRKIEEGKIKVTDLDTDKYVVSKYEVEKVTENIFKYYFRGDESLHHAAGLFGSVNDEEWVMYHVVNVGDRYVFNPSTIYTESAMSYEKVKEFYEVGFGHVVFFKE